MSGTRTVAVQGIDVAGSEQRNGSTFLSPLHAALTRARCCLLARQAPDGHWVGELQGDTILESEYVLLMAFLGREDSEPVRKAANYLLRQQLPDGGWNNYPGGPAELSVTTKAYFALKLAGHDPAAPHMRKACAVVRSLGGAGRCNSFTKFYLALLGQFPYASCPAVMPEMLLLPRWCYFNIYAMSSWTRTIVVPLSIFYAHKPVRRLPPERGIRELFLAPPELPRWPHPPTGRWLSWTNFFLIGDQFAKWLERRMSAPDGWAKHGLFDWLCRPWGVFLDAVRRRSLQRAEQWMLERFEDSDGVGAIFPPIIYTIIALRCLGYADDAPEMRWALRQLDDLIIEEGDTVRLQPCFSPVWDTALTLNALTDAGVPGWHPAMAGGARWLLAKEVRRRGDWSVANPDLEPGGWFFEYRNGFYPDTDDTAMVLMALAKTGHATSAEGRPAVERGLRWLLAMQNSDGGWAAFDRDINRELLTQVPFADHNAMLDPSCPDITARVLEALGHLGFRVGHPQVNRALEHLRGTQERFGGWRGRWGVNYLYGTWQVLVGLKSIGFNMDEFMVQKAVRWLKQVQQPGGGWGETCRSYDDPSLAGQGTPTASQTAWALLALLAAGEAESAEVRRGIDYLLATQRPDGGWHEEQFTGTGFPRVFYLKYHLYSLYFPLMALARYAAALGQKPPALSWHGNGHAGGSSHRTYTLDGAHAAVDGPRR